MDLGSKLGFNSPSSSLGVMGGNERILGSDKMNTSLTNGNGSEQSNSFPALPFFLPSLNGTALQNIAANPAMTSVASTGDRSSTESHSSKQQRDSSNSSNRNSKSSLETLTFLCYIQLPSLYTIHQFSNELFQAYSQGMLFTAFDVNIA